jgi:energy-coupling factor transport system ATP-binding protein
LAPILTVENLSYAYPTIHKDDAPEWVLREVSLAVEPGEFVALMGPTGVGKTTFCLALNGIVPHLTGGTIRGQVVVDGLDTVKHPVSRLAQSVGVVFQDPEAQLFNASVEAEVAFGLENLGIPRAEISARVAWALSLVGLADLAAASPRRLSGGQKHRVAIAALLAMRPKVLVLDEPTANLDPQGKVEVFAALGGLRQAFGTTVILVSQESEYIAELSDRVIVLVDGRVALAGSPASVFADRQSLRRIGLDVPQVSELAGCLGDIAGQAFAFTRLEDARQAIARSLEAGGR